MDKALAYVKKLNEEQKDVHVTMTHVMAHAAAWGLYKMRRDVGRLPFGFFKKSKKHGVTILVDVQGGRDLIPLTVWDAHEMTIFELANEPPKPKKFRKNVMNVLCTEYDIVKRVAKKMMDYRLKEYDEDHDGGVVNGETNQKLSTDWDVSWHDLGITADFLSKMQSY